MTKPRAVTSRDGRIGFPDIAQYELTEGDEAGQLLPVPPTYQSHPHPDPPEELYRRGIAFIDTSCAYRLLVHDQAEYDRLRLAGFWMSAEHRGKSKMFDGRATG